MTGPDEDFKRRLFATFREEADEQLSMITTGLIELERSGQSMRPELVEQVYRQIHSLKGAARAVSERKIESLCQNLENAFSAAKKGKYVPDAKAFDLFHEVVKTVHTILEGKQTGSLATNLIQNIRDLPLNPGKTEGLPGIPGIPVEGRSALNRHPGIDPEQNTGDQFSSATVKRSLSSPVTGISRDDAGKTPVKFFPEPFPEPDGTISSGDSMGSVRIATKKLDRLIAGSDDLLTTRLFITQRVQELEEMASRFSVWHWNSEMIYTDLYRIRETAFGTQKSILPPDLVLPLQRVVEFLEYDREFCNALQHDLSTHVRATELDQAALAASTQEISELIHDAVLQPVSSILVSFPGFVREFSRSSGKKAEVRTIGGEIEVDRRILDRLKDPILHLIRNSIDHGIESPRIRAAASKDESGTILIRTTTLAGSKVRIEVSDDGRGIDPAAIRRSAIENGVITPKEGVKITDDEAIWLIFRSGMSTSPVVTDLSGRGLGLAIVEDTVTRLGGELTVSTGTGKGTTITITIPVRLATFRGVVVRSGMQRFVFPMQQVQQVIRTREDGILMKGNSAVLPYQNGTIGVIRLAGILGMTGPGKSGSNPDLVPMVILAYGAGQIACMVDEVIRVQEIVVRPLGSQLRRVKWITGAAILGDGTVALVLDPLEMIQDAIKTRQPVPAPGERNERGAQTILLVEDSVTSRMLLQAILGQAGYTVMTASDGTEAFAMLKEHEFDIVVSDVDMPRMSGFTLTEKIRSDTRLSRIPVILVTSLDSQEDQEHGMAVGASAYIVKSSFERDDLLRVLEDIGRRPQ